MEQAAVILKKGEGRTLKAGGAWIFDNEIDKVEGTPEDGSLVEVRDFDGYGMGTGFYNSRSKIRVRMMSRKGRSGDRPGLPADAGAERLGLPQKDSGYFQLPDHLRRGGFPTRPGGG